MVPKAVLREASTGVPDHHRPDLQLHRRPRLSWQRTDHRAPLRPCSRGGKEMFTRLEMSSNV